MNRRRLWSSIAFALCGVLLAVAASGCGAPERAPGPASSETAPPPRPPGEEWRLVYDFPAKLGLGEGDQARVSDVARGDSGWLLTGIVQKGSGSALARAWSSPDATAWVGVGGLAMKTTFSPLRPGMDETLQQAPRCSASGDAYAIVEGGSLWFSADLKSWRSAQPARPFAKGVGTYQGRTAYPGIGSDVAVGPGGYASVGAGRLWAERDTWRRYASLWTSADGTRWELQKFDPDITGDASDEAREVMWGPSGWVAVGRVDGGEKSTIAPGVWRKRDGEPWRVAHPGAVPGVDVAELVGVAADASRYVAVGSAGMLLEADVRNPADVPLVYTSEDGLAWERRELGAPTDVAGVRLNSVAAGPNGFVVVGMRTRDGVARPVAWRSGDGVTWEVLDVLAAEKKDIIREASSFYRVAASDDTYVILGSRLGEPAMWTSP